MIEGRAREGRQRDGTCWVGGTTRGDRPAVRLSVSNWSTTPADISRSVAAVRDAVAALSRGG